MPVQKGVYYCPGHEFMAFDIKVETEKDEFWVDALDISKILKDRIKSLPIYAQGTFEEIY